MAYCHIHEGSAGVSTFPLTGRSRLLIVHFKTRAYQTTSFAVDLTNAVKVTSFGQFAPLYAQMLFTLIQFSSNKQQCIFFARGVVLSL